MKELYIVVNDNGGDPKDRIEFAFFDKKEAEKYAEKCDNNSDYNNYWVQTIYLHEESDY